ncbi:MAG: class I SAM-dependent methyltransferase [Thermotogaceae bacterium]|nr:class I SAM-dependent methyltransferase [Thermotogota bacterium]NLH18793.1 class I SAM-dependent methyltransferase [Thermotogaceae bacterium]
MSKKTIWRSYRILKTTDRKHKGERPPTERFEHYYTEKPTSSIEVRQAVFKTKGGIEVAFQTPTGVFSFGHIDRASRALVEAFHFRLGSLLDIGCGYGAIGITLKKIYPAIELYMSDINERAVRYAKVNMKNANVAGTVRHGAHYAPWEGYVFDTIVSNPPMAAGKAVWTELVESAPRFLKPGGSLQIVAFHRKGGERVMKTMKAAFGNMAVRVKTGGIWVYESVLVTRNPVEIEGGKEG